MANSVDPDQTAPIGAVCSGSTLFASILYSSVMLGKYLQQATSADDIFRCIFCLGALRVKSCLGVIQYLSLPGPLAQLAASPPADLLVSPVQFRPLLYLNFVVCLFVLLLYVPSQQLWSLRDGQFT